MPVRANPDSHSRDANRPVRPTEARKPSGPAAGLRAAPIGLLASQRILGNRQTVERLAAGAPIPGVARRTPSVARASRSTPRVQRLVDRQGLQARAGRAKGNVGLKKMSVQYKAVLSKLDAYHAKSDQLWQGNVTGVAYADALNPLLDDLATATWAYVGDREDSDRAPHLRELVSVEIPAERRRLKAAASRSDFADIDRAAPAAEVGTGRSATVAGAGIDVGYATVVDQAEGGIAQCHSMALWVDLDAGDRPLRMPTDPPDSIYGATLEYWEEVKVDYNFVELDRKKVRRLKANGEGQSNKQWNDIKMHTPDSPTFAKVGGQIELSWPDAVRRAATLQLRGRKKVGFADMPGVTPIAGKYIKRTLNFRIVIKDGSNRREIYATQVIVCDGNKDLPASMTYVDSLGNALGRTRPATDATQMADMADDDDRLEDGLDVAAGDVSRAVPANVRSKIQPFVRALVTHKAPVFRNRELEQVQAKFPTAGDLSGPYKAYSKLGQKKYNTASDYYEIAGMNSAPYPQPGFTYHEHVLRGDARLMAVMKGDQLIRMYYTDGKTRPVGAQQVPVRSFGEIPVEEAQAYVESERNLKSADRAEQVGIDAAVAVRANQMDQMEMDIGAAVLLSKQDRGVAVRQLLERNPRDYLRIETWYDRDAGGDTLAAMLRRFYTRQMRNKTLDAGLYEQLAKRFPHPRARAALAEAWMAVAKKATPTKSDATLAADLATIVSASRSVVGAAPGLEQAVRNANGDLTALKTQVMAYAESHMKEQPTLEKVYNGTIPALNLAGVPASIGPLISEYFVDQFKTSGALPTFSAMINKYPGLEYRLRPAYRQVHGDKALAAVADRYRAVDAAAEVPDPGGAANLAAKSAFLAHQPFTQAGFASSVEKRAKFDTSYDPATGVLKVTLKLSFTFQDTTDAPAKIKGKEVGKQFANQQWSDEAKQKYIDDFRAAVRDTWSANAPLIRCTRPGWEDIVARPTFVVEEVPLGQEHNPVTVRKAVLTDAGTGNKAKKIGGVRSGWGGAQTILNEADVADKISDPAVHRYLHGAERTQNIEPAFVLDNNQLIRRLKDYGTLKFATGGVALEQANRVDVLVGEIARLQIDPALASLHALQVVAPTLAGMDAQRADAIANQLATRGVKNPTAKVADATVAADTVVVRAAPPDPAVKDVYVTKWSRITAAHEFGHMLGLMDEYYGAKSGDVVMKMISDGLLPPDTRADHLIANPPAANQDEATGQEATVSLLERAQLSTADFTLADGARSSSLMTGGYELWPQHYVTVWEALTKLTAAELGERFWKLG